MSGRPVLAHGVVMATQVAEIIITLEGEAGRRGSGYRVGPTAVLTAAHVVEGAVSVRVRFDADLPGEWTTEAISCWTDLRSDLAVLTIARRQGEPLVTVARFGRIGGDRAAVLAVQAVGFPRFKLKTDDGDRPVYRDSHQAVGSVAVLSNRREGTLEVTVPRPERDPDPATSPWEGMSGAAVWVGDRIVGVIAKHHCSDGLGRLAVARLDLAIEGFDASRCAELRALIGVSEVLPDVVPPSAGERITTAYQAQVRDIAPDQLLDREQELDELVGFCAGDQPYVWWQAGPWAGKSALMAWFVLHPPAGVDVVSFFVTARLAGQSDSDACTTALIEQLAALLGESPASLLTTVARRGTMLRLLEDAASRSQEAGRRLLLVIDGLDEDSGTATGPSIAALLPRRLPPEVRILVASRPHPRVPDDVADDHPMRTIRPRQLSVFEHARGVERSAKRELKQLLAGEQLQRDVLGLITAAGGGITLPELEELTKHPPYEIGHLLGGLFGRSVGSRISSLAVGRHQDEPVYLFTHETLRLVAEKQFGNSLATYRDKLHQWADTWRTAGWPADTPQYLLRSYPRMLASTGNLARLVALATDPARHDRIRDLTGGDALAFTEISTAQQLILAQPEPDLASLALLAVQRDHLVKRNTYIPTGLPAVWAKLGQLTRADALAHSIPNPSQRAMALGSLAEAVVPSGDLDRAEAVIAQITDLHVRANALAKVSRAAGVRGNLDRATRLTDEIRTLVGLPTDPIAQAGALLALVEATAASGDIDTAQALMGQMIPGQRDWALPALVEAAVATGDLAQAEDLARLAKDPFLRVCAFLPLLLLASDHGAQAARLATEVEIFAGQITDLGLRRFALVGLAQAAARADDLDRTVRLTTDVETLAELITDPYTRLQALIQAVAVRGDHARTAQLAKEAYALTTQETDLYLRVSELTRLANTVASGGNHSLGTQLATEVETLAAQNFDSVGPEHALAQLSEALAAAGDLERAEDIAGRLIRPAEQASALLALVEATAAGGDLDRAQALMRQIIPGQRDWALPALVKAAVAAGDLDQVELLIGLATNPIQKVRASLPLLISTGDHDARSARLAAEAESLAEQITDPFERAWALTWLAEAAAWVGDIDRAARLTTKVESLARQTTDPSLLVPTLAVLVRVVTAGGDRDRAARLTDEAETFTRQSTIPDHRAWALGRLAQAVAAGGNHDGAARLAGEAEAVTSEINDPGQRVRALAELAKAVAAGGDHDQAARLAADAETLASQITSLDQRAAALVRLARTLLDISKELHPAGEPAHSGSPVLVRVRSLIAEALVTGSWTAAVSGLARVDPLAVRVLADDLETRWGFNSPSSSRDGRAGQS